MTTDTTLAINGVHLVGSIPLSDEREVFATVGPALGSRLRRLPDGETGDRQGWVQFTIEVLGARDEFEIAVNSVPGMGELPPTLKLKEGVNAADVEFGALGYEERAFASFAEFEKAQAAGLIPEDVRFQVSIPTPLANAVSALRFNDDFPVLYSRYEAALLAEVQRIADRIPPEKLAIQWDVCFELLMAEGWMPMTEEMTKASIADDLVRISDAVPEGVELGFHFCYGDLNHEHVNQPTDLGILVELANGFLPRIGRSVEFVQLPVPIDRSDDAYFAPLADLKLPEGTELYLGLLHFRDGVEGASARIAAASRVVSGFGVATECGMGRRPEERGGGTDTFRELLELHMAVADEVSA